MEPNHEIFICHTNIVLVALGTMNMGCMSMRRVPLDDFEEPLKLFHNNRTDDEWVMNIWNYAAIEGIVPLGVKEYKGFYWTGWNVSCLKQNETDYEYNNTDMWQEEPDFDVYKQKEDAEAPVPSFTYCFDQCVESDNCKSVNLLKKKRRRVKCDDSNLNCRWKAWRRNEDPRTGPGKEEKYRPDKEMYQIYAQFPHFPLEDYYPDTMSPSQVARWGSLTFTCWEEFVLHYSVYPNGSEHECFGDDVWEEWEEEAHCDFQPFNHNFWCETCRLHKMNESAKTDMRNLCRKNNVARMHMGYPVYNMEQQYYEPNERHWNPYRYDSYEHYNPRQPPYDREGKYKGQSLRYGECYQGYRHVNSVPLPWIRHLEAQLPQDEFETEDYRQEFDDDGAKWLLENYRSYDMNYSYDLWCWQWWEKLGDVDECNDYVAKMCKEPLVCKNIPGSYTCECEVGFINSIDNATGDVFCSDIDECQLDVHDCPEICQNNQGSFYCLCASELGYQLMLDGVTCEYVCHNQGTYDTESMQCHCTEHWSGAWCTEDYPECMYTDPCSENGICIEASPGYYCYCQEGFAGVHCDNGIRNYMNTDLGLACVLGGILMLIAVPLCIATRVCLMRPSKRLYLSSSQESWSTMDDSDSGHYTFRKRRSRLSRIYGKRMSGRKSRTSKIAV